MQEAGCSSRPACPAACMLGCMLSYKELVDFKATCRLQRCVCELCRYEDSMGRKKVLEDELNDLEGKLQRAEKLVTGENSVRCTRSCWHACQLYS